MKTLVRNLLAEAQGKGGRHYLWNITDPSKAYYPNKDGNGGNSHSNRQGMQSLDPNTGELETLK